MTAADSNTQTPRPATGTAAWEGGDASLDLAERYDRLMFRDAHIAYFGQSDFTNFGYWDDAHTTQRAASENLVDKLVEMIPDASLVSRDASIGDIACGKGATTAILRQRLPKARITGTNISHRQLSTARQNAPDCDFALMDAARLGLADGSFDHLVCIEAAFHFATREDFLREAWRVLRPGGSVVLSDILMNRAAEARRPYRHEVNFVDGIEAYRELCERCGFGDIRVVDATVECWHRCFWFAVDFIHRQFLQRQVSLDELRAFLELSYGRAADIESYLLVSCQKPQP